MRVWGGARSSESNRKLWKRQSFDVGVPIFLRVVIIARCWMYRNHGRDFSEIRETRYYFVRL